MFDERAPLDLAIVGRVVFHAALVGLAAGLVGALFFASLEFVQHVLLERLVGYHPLRAHGEKLLPEGVYSNFHPWILLILPALGGLVCGLITQFAPEVRGAVAMQ